MSCLWQAERRSHWGLSTWRAQTVSWTGLLRSSPPRAIIDDVWLGPSRILKQQGSWLNNRAVNYLFPCCERGAQDNATSQRGAVQLGVCNPLSQQWKPSKWLVPSLLSMCVSSNQSCCKVWTSPRMGFQIPARTNRFWTKLPRNLEEVFFFWGPHGHKEPPGSQPCSAGSSGHNAQAFLPILWLKKLPVRIDDLLWGLSIILALCLAVTSIRIWLTEAAWVICKEQQGFSFIILVGGQGANDWAWIRRERNFQGRRMHRWLPKRGSRGCGYGHG